MKTKQVPPVLNVRKLLLLAVALCCSLLGEAQTPTSLSYPTPNVYIANVSNVFLSPNVAGNVTGYSINPATLPTGLTFAPATGIISGTPTAASPATIYTVTATGGTGSTATTLSLQVTNNFFNNAYSVVDFSNSTPIRGTGTTVGDTVLYTNVATLSGQSIDVLVITKSLTNVGTFVAYDQAALSGGGYSNNSPAFFSPQFNFSAAGSAIFNFQFILGGSFNTTTKTAQSVTLQNVKINTYDIDGNGTAGTNQYTEFGGFDTSEVGAPTVIAASFDAVTNLTKFRSNISTNSVPVTADSTRIRVTNNNISNFTIALGADGPGFAYYFLDFSSGAAFATAVKTPAPSLDLNTSLPGVNNVGSGCGSLLAFAGTGQTNIRIVPATLDELTVTFDNSTTNIRDGAGERIVINGGTPNTADTLLLNFTAGTSPTVTVGGVTFAVTRKVSGTTSELSFVNNAGGTFTLAQGEALLDALLYGNTTATPTMGERNFIVNVRNASFKSPDAIFSPNVSCVSISGNIFIDNNGLTDNTVNANSTIGQLAANGAYAVLTSTTGTVLAVQGVAAGGAYSFGKQSQGTYNIIIRSTAPAIGATISAATFPTATSGTYLPMGENLGAGAGNDLQTNGILRVTVGSANITDANFGMDLAPVTANTSVTGVPNPGGYNTYTFPNGGFNAADQDGGIVSMTITAFPAGANYLKVGSTFYTSTGSTCPPQATCVAWPSTLVVPFTGGNPASTISVDPLSTGITTVTVPFTAVDAAGVVSNASTASVAFTAVTPLTISGNVWNDSDANGVRNGTEALTNAAASGQTLYAYLVQTNTAKTYNGQPTIYASVAVNATTGYSFTDVAGANDYEVHIVSSATQPVAGALASSVAPALATNYVGVSTSRNGVATPNLNTVDPFVTITALAADAPNNNIGIERKPAGGTFTTAKQANPGVGVQAVVPAGAFSATDAEDATSGYANNLTGRKITLNPATNGTLYYNGVAVTAATTFTNFDPTKVTIAPLAVGAVTPSFTYAVFDNAGIASTPGTVNVPLDVAITISGTVWNDINGDAVNASEAFTNGGGLIAVLTDASGNVIETNAVNATTGLYTFAKSTTNQAYRILLSATTPALGSNVTAASLLTLATNPWAFTGTNLSGTANAVNRTGIASVTTGTVNLTNQNFGIEQAPEGANYTMTKIANPGAALVVPIAPAAFTGTDLTDPAYPVGLAGRTVILNPATGGTLYYNGVAVTGAQITGFDPTLVTLDPTGTGTTAGTATFTYSVLDNAKVPSTPKTVTVPLGALSTISGTIWDDANGTAVKDAGEGFTNAGGLFAVLTDATTNTVLQSVAVDPATGAYSFNRSSVSTNYKVLLSTTSPDFGSTLTSSTLPAPTSGAWRNTGVNLTGAANNTNRTGIIAVTTPAAADLPLQNFGIDQAPVGAAFTAARQANPGTATQVAVPSGAFSANDVEDAAAGYANNLNGRTVTLAGTTGGTLYYNGGVYTLGTPITGFDPTKVSILPSAAGALTPTFTFSVLDNAGIASTPVLVSLPLDVAVTVSGSVWDDADGNAVRNTTTEPLTGAGGALYAILTDAAGNVIQSVLVNNTSGAYSFANAAGSQSYKVVLSTTNAVAGTKITASSLPGNWMNTGTNLSTTASTTNQTGIITITTPSTGTLAAQDFGIEQRATADAKGYTIAGNTSPAVTTVSIPSTVTGGGTYTSSTAMSGTASSGATPGILTGTDADGGTNGASLALGATPGATIKVSINPSSYIATNASGTPVAGGVMLLYNGVQLQPGGCQGGNVGNGLCASYNATSGAWEIANFNASLLSILTKSGVKTESFQYSYIDAANKAGTLATYSIIANTPLPVELLSFTAMPKAKTVMLDWKVASEARLSGYVVERSADAVSFNTIGKVAAHNTGREDSYQQIDAAPLSGNNYYRLRIEESDGTYNYSAVQLVRMDGVAGNTISIYPNPLTTAGMVTIHVSVAPEAGVVRIMDQAGRLLVQQSLEKALDTKVDLSTLPAGMYLVSVVADGQTQVTKLVIR